MPEGNAISLQLPNGKTITAVEKSTQFGQAGLAWQGSVSGDPLSAVTLILNGWDIRGGIATAGKSYSIRSMRR